jgi:hypothetical protein
MAAQVNYQDGVRAGTFVLFWSDRSVAARGKYRHGKAGNVTHEDSGSGSVLLPMRLSLERLLVSLHSFCERLILLTEDNRVLAFSPEMEPLWSHKLAGAPSKPLDVRMSAGKCFVGAETAAGLVLLDSRDGQVASLPKDADVLTTHGQEVVLSAAEGPARLPVDGITLELSPDGRGVTVQDARKPLSSGPWSLPSELVCPGRLTVVHHLWSYYFACPGKLALYVLHTRGGLSADPRKLLAPRWTYGHQDHSAPRLPDEGSAVLDEGLAYYFSEDKPGVGCTFDLYSGARLACFEGAGDPPAFAQGVLYRWEPSGRAIEARDALFGEVLWRRPWSADPSEPASAERAPVLLSKDRRAVSVVAKAGGEVRVSFLDVATGEVIKALSFEAGDIGQAAQDYFQVDGPMVAFPKKRGVVIIDTAAMEKRCEFDDYIPMYLLRDGRAFLLKERAVQAVSTKTCKKVWSYRTGDFAVLSIEMLDRRLHLSGMLVGGGEPLENSEDLDLATGVEVEKARGELPPPPEPAWRRPPWTPVGDVVGLAREGGLRGLDTRRSSAARGVAEDPIPRDPSAASVDGGAASGP